MIYSGEFYDINKVLYKVRISTSKGDATRTITLAGSPFTTEMEGDGKTIYKPVKYQSATVSIITPDYNFDIYSGYAQGTKVELLNESGGIVWIGYVTPNLYDMGFVEQREEVQIECIDALSTLQYIKYDSVDKSNATFLDIIYKVLNKCNAYRYFYFTNNIQLTKDGADTILDKLSISENNFFDKKEDNETDEDVAWTMQEVLEEICQYLGVTAIADGDCVYFMDYDAIKAGNNSYYKYDLSSKEAAPSLQTKQFSRIITAKDYSGSDNTLSLDNVYNKVVIEDDIYNIENILPDVFNAENLELCSFGDDNLKPNYRGEARGIEVFNINSKGYNAAPSLALSFVQYYKIKNSDSISTINYKPDKGIYTVDPINEFYSFTPTIETKTETNWNRQEMEKSVGCGVMKYAYVSCTDKQESEDIDKYLDKKYKEVNKIDLKDAIFIAIPDDQPNGNPKGRLGYPATDATARVQTDYFDKQPLLTLKSGLLSVNKSMNLVISGKFTFYFLRQYLPYDEKEQSNNHTSEYGQYYRGKGSSNMFFSIKFGDYYYSGNKAMGKNGWVQEFTTVPVKLDIKSGAKNFGETFEIKDTTHWADKITDEEGFVIPFPTTGNEAMYNRVEITLYRPFGVDISWCARFATLEDFKCKIVGKEDVYALSKDDSNTVYTNIIDDNNVTELSDIKFKICTWDNKQPNYSAVCCEQNGNYSYLDRTFNKALYNGEQSWSSSNPDNPSSKDGLRQEEHLIYKLVNQYSTPSVILNLALRNDNKIYGLYGNSTISNKDFIIDSMNVDYKYNSADIKLIEKK